MRWPKTDPFLFVILVFGVLGFVAGTRGSTLLGYTERVYVISAGTVGGIVFAVAGLMAWRRWERNATPRELAISLQVWTGLALISLWFFAWAISA